MSTQYAKGRYNGFRGYNLKGMVGMQGSLIGILFMAVVVIIGAVIGVLYSRSSIQLRAVIVSFATLGLVVIAFCVGAIGYSLWWSPWIFALAAIVVPPVSYFVVAFGLNGSKSHEAKRPRRAVSQPKPVKTKPGIAKPAHVFKATLEVTPAVEPILVIEATLAAEARPAVETTPAVEARPEPKSAAKPMPPAKPAPTSTPASVTTLIFAPTPKPVPVVPSVPVSTSFNADEYFERASALRDKRLYPVAARLYVECVEFAQDRASIKKAQLEQLSCYVQANMPEQARKLAEELHGAKDLSPLETLKVETVLRKL